VLTRTCTYAWASAPSGRCGWRRSTCRSYARGRGAAAYWDD